MFKHGRLLWFIISLVFLAVPVICVTRAVRAMSALETSDAVSHLSVNALAMLTTQYLLLLYLGYLIGALAALSLVLCVVSAVRSKL
jgi:hypothetical protein